MGEEEGEAEEGGWMQRRVRRVFPSVSASCPSSAVGTGLTSAENLAVTTLESGPSSRLGCVLGILSPVLHIRI